MTNEIDQLQQTLEQTRFMLLSQMYGHLTTRKRAELTKYCAELERQIHRLSDLPNEEEEPHGK